MIRNTISEFYNDTLKYDHISFEDMSWPGIETQSHTGYEMIFLKSGDATFIADEKIFSVKPGSIILTPPNTRHIINFNETAYYDRFDVIFDPSVIHPEVYKEIPSGANVFCTEKPEYFLSLFEKIDFYCRHFSGDSLCKIILNVVEEIFYNIAIETKETSGIVPYDNYISDSTFTKIIEFISKNITNPFTLEDMCDELYISKSNLHKLFSKHLGKSPKKYITEKRLAIARLEILSGSLPTEVFRKYGFSDYSSFYRSYRAYYGHSPSET